MDILRHFARAGAAVFGLLVLALRPDTGLAASAAEIEIKTDATIKQFVETLRTHGVITERDLTEIESEVKKIVDGSVDFARRSPIPQPDDLYDDIYSGEFPDARRRDPWR